MSLFGRRAEGLGYMTELTGRERAPYPVVAILFGAMFALAAPLYLAFQENPKGSTSSYLASPTDYVGIISFSMSIIVVIYYALKSSVGMETFSDVSLLIMMSSIFIFGFVMSDTIITNRSAFINAESVAKEFSVVGIYDASSKSGVNRLASIGIKDKYRLSINVPIDENAYIALINPTSGIVNNPRCIKLTEQKSGIYRRVVVERRQYGIDSFYDCDLSGKYQGRP